MAASPTSYDDVRAALDSIPPDMGHADRVRLAFAVHDGIGDSGAELWQEWAARRSNPDAAEDRATWKSARNPGLVKVATLFGIAKAHGHTRKAVADARTDTERGRTEGTSEGPPRCGRT